MEQTLGYLTILYNIKITEQYTDLDYSDTAERTYHIMMNCHSHLNNSYNIIMRWRVPIVSATSSFNRINVSAIMSLFSIYFVILQKSKNVFRTRGWIWCQYF